MARLPLRRNERLMTVLVIAVPMAVCALLPYLFSGVMPEFEARKLFRFKDGVWTHGPDVPGPGEALADQGRYEDARKCLQNAIEMGDTPLGSSRVDLAELLLKRGTDPQKALDLIDEALRVAKGRIAARLEPSRWAARAWALALLGRRQEAGHAIERALRACPVTYAPLLASTRLHVAMALLAMEETGKAIEHLRAARDEDPNGKYGALALQQLKLHSLWGE